MKQLVREIWEWMKVERRNLLIIAVVVVAAYINMLPNQFVWDDGYFVGWEGYRGNTLDIAGILEGKVPMAYGQVYRPLRGLWYVLSVNVWDMWVVGYHLQGLAVHLIITTMVYWIANILACNSLPRIRSGSPLKRESHRIALISALLFGVHPIHTEAVSWITASFDTIGIAFMFASLIAYMQYINSKFEIRNPKHIGKDGKIQRYKTTSLVLAGLAFFTYELTFVLIPIVWLMERLIRNKTNRTNGTDKTYVQLVLMVVGYFVVKAMVLPPDMNRLPWLFGGFLEAVLFVPVVLWSYIRYMIFPFPQSTNHLIFPGVHNLYYADGGVLLKLTLNIWSVEYLVGLGILVGLGVVGYFWGKKNKFVWFAGLWTVVSLVPVLQLVPLNSVFAERYTYIASFGICLLGAIGIEGLSRVTLSFGKLRISLKKGESVVGTIIIALLIALTMQRNRVWGTTVTLWEDAVKAGPVSAYALRNLGASYYIYKDYDRAIKYYLQAKAAQPTHFETYQKLVYLYDLIGQSNKSLEVKNEAKELFLIK
jgi:hypothetical protein